MHFMFSFIFLYSNFGIEVTYYYMMATGFLVHSFFKFFVEHHCFVVVVAGRGIDLYDLQCNLILHEIILSECFSNFSTWSVKFFGLLTCGG